LKYLITGATGFIGPHLIRQLLDQGHHCRCLARSDRTAKGLGEYPVEVIQGDVTRAETLQGAGEGVDCVLHLATLGHMSNFTVTEEMFEAVNVEGTRNVMQEALRAGVARVVHCSSVAAMGICSENPADESTPCRPHHPYGRSKLKAEKLVRELVDKEGLPAVIVRFSMVYGPGDWRDMLKLTRLAKKGMFPKVGSRAKLTPLIHVADAVRGLLLAAQKGRVGEPYLITNRDSIPFDDLRKMLQAALGVRRIPLYVPEWAALAAAAIIEKSFTAIGKSPPVARKNIESTLADRVFSIDKAAAELGFEPQVDPTAGIAETVAWYRENGWI
jgi:nucleoside-diphosphate-sugar epimerase